MAEQKKVICPECETEVTLTDGEGECSKCGLDVGEVLERDRYERALQKVRERREKEAGGKSKSKKRHSHFSF